MAIDFETQAAYARVLITDALVQERRLFDHMVDGGWALTEVAQVLAPLVAFRLGVEEELAAYDEQQRRLHANV